MLWVMGQTGHQQVDCYMDRCVRNKPDDDRHSPHFYRVTTAQLIKVKRSEHILQLCWRNGSYSQLTTLSILRIEWQLIGMSSMGYRCVSVHQKRCLVQLSTARLWAKYIERIISRYLFKWTPYSGDFCQANRCALRPSKHAIHNVSLSLAISNRALLRIFWQLLAAIVFGECGGLNQSCRWRLGPLLYEYL